MRESLPTRLLLMLAEATPEKLAAVERLLECGVRSGECGVINQSQADRGARSPQCGIRQPASVFRWTGRDWKVVFAGGEPFYLPDTLGARYVDYLLHHPNEPISAFDLEVEITPEKGEARSGNSIQLESDARALGEYRQELRRLQTELEEARAADDANEVQRLEREIEALAAALKGNRAGADAGERARVNVRKAVAVVLAQLRKGGPVQAAFAEHLEHQLSTGYECLYSQAEGNIWS
jgi:hypothetical protein